MIDPVLFELRRYAFRFDLLNGPAYSRIMRWPGAVAMAIGMLCNRIVWLAGAPLWAQFLTAFCVTFAVMSWLLPRAFRRAVWRKWNSLEA